MELANKLALQFNGKVQSGPFAGMLLDPAVFPQHMSPKLLGIYEDELHHALEKLRRKPIKTIVNIGCAEGYYAVGCALLWPDALVYAFDLDPGARRATRRHAQLNGVEHRVRVLSAATTSTLSSILGTNISALVICDCEGCEEHLIDPSRVRGLREAHVIVEMHPKAVPDIEQILPNRLQDTHNVALVSPQPKGPENYSHLLLPETFSLEERSVVFNEFRGYTPWLVGAPLSELS